MEPTPFIFTDLCINFCLREQGNFLQAQMDKDSKHH